MSIAPPSVVVVPHLRLTEMGADRRVRQMYAVMLSISTDMVIEANIYELARRTGNATNIVRAAIDLAVTLGAVARLDEDRYELLAGGEVK